MDGVWVREIRMCTSYCILRMYQSFLAMIREKGARSKAVCPKLTRLSYVVVGSPYFRIGQQSNWYVVFASYQDKARSLGTYGTITRNLLITYLHTSLVCWCCPCRIRAAERRSFNCLRDNEWRTRPFKQYLDGNCDLQIWKMHTQT